MQGYFITKERGASLKKTKKKEKKKKNVLSVE